MWQVTQHGKRAREGDRMLFKKKSRGKVAADIAIKIDNTELIKNATKEQIIRALEECGLTAERYAKANCPVDTGNLRNSITHQMSGDKKVLIGTNVEYGAYVELGTGKYTKGGGGRKTPWIYQDDKGNWHRTSGQKPHPYLKPAVSGHIAEYKRIIKSNLES